MFRAKFGGNQPNGFGVEVESVRSLQMERRTDGQTDVQYAGQKVIKINHLRFQLK